MSIKRSEEHTSELQSRIEHSFPTRRSSDLNIAALLKELPPGVSLLAAAKSRTPQEIEQALEAGIRLIGENYLQDAEEA
jgi:uncharacterized pyridoxal phosphate-containing UPF0001 family protein